MVVMYSNKGDAGRQESVCHQLVDPIARRALKAVEPLEAYEATMDAGGVLLDEIDWLPDGGAVYSQWMELSDLFDHPRSLLTAEAAQTAVRRAAQDWLNLPREHGALKRWAEVDDYFAGAYPE